MKEPLRSALVDLVMPDASEEERVEATRRWFEFLGVLADMADRHIRERDSRESSADDRVTNIDTTV